MNQQHVPLSESDQGEGDEQAINRRHFLAAGFWAVSGITTLLFGGAGSRFFIGAAFDPEPEQWVKVGEIADLPPGQVHRTNYVVRVFDAWREVEQKGLLYVFSDDGLQYSVLDAACTHLGCNVRWQETETRFVCPCHGGLFSREGQVVSGPPPAPLRRLESKIQNGMLMVLI